MYKKFLVAFSLILVSIVAFSQPSEAPYLRFKIPPPAKLVTGDSVQWELKPHLQKKKPLMIVVFSPECDHCKHETEQLVKNIDKFKNIQIIMATPLPLAAMNEFAKNYQLAKYPNITVVRDYGYFLPTYYNISSLPFHAFYDADKKLIGVFEGSMSIEKILANFK